jgi:chromosome segregation ATPase
MHKTIVAAGAVAIMLLAGCGAEEKRLEGELSLATARVTELEQAVSQAGMRADSLALSLTQTEQQAQRVRDSLAEADKALNAAVVKAQRVEARLQNERDVHRRSLDSANQVRMALESDVKERETQVASLETQLQVALTESDRIRAQKDSLLAFVDDLRPWYEYYKKDSGRNWAKKLFGAGRAKKPTTPEPAFQPRVEPNLEAERP